jgi:hypothetical protein
MWLAAVEGRKVHRTSVRVMPMYDFMKRHSDKRSPYLKNPGGT